VARFVVAVSGGVDSVALLDMMARRPEDDIIVAHVDHGIRSNSIQDARFVESLAHQYRLPFESIRYELGPGASEEAARNARYDFLKRLAEKYAASVVTAHHSDDVLESIAIHMLRGTGWRGLATHDSDVTRPLLGITKQRLLEYAMQRGLAWREDETNQSDAYLRNRIRRHVAALPQTHKDELLRLRRQQLAYKKAIDDEVRRVVGSGPDFSRYFFTHIPRNVALECLRAITKSALTRPQCERMLHAIKTAAAGTRFEAGAGVTVQFTTRQFSVALL
jgi:tRNA(Ile)-lysidine synthase